MDSRTETGLSMDRPHLPPGVTAGGQGSNAAGRDVFVTNNNGTKGFHADSETFTDLIEKKYQLQQQITELSQRLLQYESYVRNQETTLSEWKRAAASERQRASDAEQEVLRLRRMPSIPTARVIQWASLAVVGVAVLVLVVAQISGSQVRVKEVATPAKTTTVTLASTQTSAPDPVTANGLAAASMPCTPGSVIVQVGVYPTDPPDLVLARAKLLVTGHEISRTNVSTSVQVTGSDAVCSTTNPQSPLGMPGTNDLVVWVGPFGNLPEANSFCTAMGWNPLRMTSCYTHQVK